MKTFTKKEEQILLAVCQLGRKASLVPIRRKMLEFTGKSYSVGTIYAPLNRLHVRGYLESRSRNPEGAAGGKPVKFYSLTRMGREALADIQRQNEKMWHGIDIPALMD